VQTDHGTQIILDCGTGASGLGRELAASGVQHGSVLISHTHWDHIQGIPFFGPLFIPGNEWDIFGPGASGDGMQSVLRGQMERTYFPVRLDQLSAAINYHDLDEGTFEIGEVTVRTRYLNHTAVTLGYRLEVGGVSIVYSSDHEPHSPLQADPAPPSRGTDPVVVHAEDEKHAEFLADADLVIHDTQYTAREYEAKMGWGHSTVEYAVDLAVAAGVKRLVLFHHDPLRSDDLVDDLVSASRMRAQAWGSELDLSAAGEGGVIELREQKVARRAGPAKVLVVDDDPGVVDSLSFLLQAEGYRLVTAADGEHGLEVARAEHPDLILLDWRLPGMDGPSVSRALRTGSDRELRRVPVLMLTALDSADDTMTAFEAGADDYITKPFTPASVLVHVRQWLKRSEAA
jgi:CheY-like chemotaxis protein